MAMSIDERLLLKNSKESSSNIYISNKQARSIEYKKGYSADHCIMLNSAVDAKGKDGKNDADQKHSKKWYIKSK